MTVTTLLLNLAMGAIAVAVALGWLGTAGMRQPLPVRVSRKR
jgi:hypothetical protein